MDKLSNTVDKLFRIIAQMLYKIIYQAVCRWIADQSLIQVLNGFELFANTVFGCQTNIFFTSNVKVVIHALISRIS